MGKQLLDKMSIRVSKKKAQHRPAERLTVLAGEVARSVNYLVVEAVLARELFSMCLAIQVPL